MSFLLTAPAESASVALSSMSQVGRIPWLRILVANVRGVATTIGVLATEVGVRLTLDAPWGVLCTMVTQSEESGIQISGLISPGTEPPPDRTVDIPAGSEAFTLAWTHLPSTECFASSNVLVTWLMAGATSGATATLSWIVSPLHPRLPASAYTPAPSRIASPIAPASGPISVLSERRRTARRRPAPLGVEPGPP
jgi:hypothetical protein